MINDSTLSELLVSGMRAEGVRQKAIANNVANMNTPGFRRSDINFEEELSKAIDKEGNLNPDKLDVEVKETLNTRINVNGSDVSLDSEVGEMVKNTLRHRTYMLILRKKYEQMDLASKL